MSGFTIFWLVAMTLVPGARSDSGTSRRELEQCLGLLQYVAGDYAAAVSEQGNILDRSEYDEQLSLLQQVESALARAGGAKASTTRGRARALHQAASKREAPVRFVPKVNQLHAEIVRVFGLELAPTTIPSLVTGRILYQQSCVECHAEDGSAETARAKTLDPPPSSFLSEASRLRLSPYHVYNIATFGVPGTAMASFEALDEVERWDLGYYVVSLRHAGIDLGDSFADTPELSLRDLARATDTDLEKLLLEHSPEARVRQIARWRRVLPLRLGD